MGVIHRDPSVDLHATHSKTKGVEADIQRASDNAGVIGTVLTQEIPDGLQVGDVAEAIAQTGDLEHKLAESAATLAEVSAELGREISKRHKADAALDKSRARVEVLSAEARKKKAQ